jgi:hypothetical protein
MYQHPTEYPQVIFSLVWVWREDSRKVATRVSTYDRSIATYLVWHSTAPQILVAYELT